MLIRRHLRWTRVLKTASKFLTYIVVLSLVAYLGQDEKGVFGTPISRLLPHIPFSLVGALGTALAIFLGFRNNSAYDRWWEARKIWGGIINTSRRLGRQVTTFLIGDISDDDRHELERSIVYRHLAWVNAMRIQLRKQDDWDQIKPFLSDDEFHWLMQRRNKATQLVQRQGETIRDALRRELLSDFCHVELDRTLTELYELQGKAERIKNTPLPRQYDFFTRMFLYLYTTMMPFGMVSELDKVGRPYLVMILAPAVAFMFYVLMRVGEFNEDPFESRITDTPMTALCRTIEIDLREQLGETDLPPAIEPKDGVLM